MKGVARLKVLPLLVVVAALSFGVRFSEFVTGVSDMPGYANAKEPVVEAIPDEKLEAVQEKPEENKKEESSPTSLPDLSEGEKIDWRDSGEAELEYSSVKMELFEDLKIRRKELDGQKRELSVREALLKTAEQELNQKLLKIKKIS